MEQYEELKTCNGERGVSVCWWKTRGNKASDVVDRMRWHMEHSYLNDIFSQLLVDAIEEITYLRGYRDGKKSS